MSRNLDPIWNIEIHLKSVKSSNIQEVGFSSNTLEVKFWGEKIYRYHPVTEDAYNQMINAESVGSWFNKNIRDNNLITCFKK